MLTSLSREPIHDELIARLKALITSEGLQPGDRLPGEAQLSERLGVGRPALREAFRAMEAVGAIETRKGVGRFVGAFAPEAYVRNFTTDSLIASFSELELAETRCLLEIALIPTVIDRLTAEDLDELRDLLARMEHKIEKDENFVTEDLGMHRVLMRHAENRLIATMLDAVYALSLARAQSPESPIISEHRIVDIAQHRLLAEAVFARDRDLAQQRLMEHFETTAERQGFTPLWKSLPGIR
ncbi:MAG TPA: FCD domain-containing protein [Thermomicrobiales bacterium]|nr:FCD domain-containing protein [Thermomicrobiales bacterium]